MGRRWYTNPESQRRTLGYRKTDVIRPHRRRTPAELAALPTWTLTFVLHDRLPGLDVMEIEGKNREWLLCKAAVDLLTEQYPRGLWGVPINATLTRPAEVATVSGPPRTNAVRRAVQFSWQSNGWALIEGKSFRSLRAA